MNDRGDITAPTFICANCGKRNPVPGRRLRFLRGLRQYICKACDLLLKTPTPR